MEFTSFDILFLTIFVLRYLRLIVHLFSFWALYRPSKIPENWTPIYNEKSVAVVIPTVDPLNPWFNTCIRSVASNGPGAIFVVTAGKQLQDTVESILKPFVEEFPDIKFTVLRSATPNKRIQVAKALPLIPPSMPLVALVDDTASWSSKTFLSTAITPFEDAKAGLVGTNKRVRRLEQGTGLAGFWKGYWNFLGCIYLERHNFEIRATNAIDGGVFVVSGRTAVIRTQIVQDQAFIDRYIDERVLGFGPLAADDDNFVTRWMVKNGWDIKIQYCEDAVIEVTVGTYPRFLSQCLRWVRTTWRSNSCSLFTDRTVWWRQPWCVYAVYFTSFVNFALFNDIWFLWAVQYTTFFSSWQRALMIMYFWIFVTKMVKPFPYFLRNPKDLLYLPGMILFGWYHSFIKLYALFTFHVFQWGGRNLAVIGTDDDESDDKKPSTNETEVISTAQPSTSPQDPEASSPAEQWDAVRQEFHDRENIVVVGI